MYLLFIYSITIIIVASFEYWTSLNRIQTINYCYSFTDELEVPCEMCCTWQFQLETEKDRSCAALVNVDIATMQLVF